MSSEELGLGDTLCWLHDQGLRATIPMIRQAEERDGWVTSHQRGPRARKTYDRIQREKLRRIFLLRMLGCSTWEINAAIKGNLVLVRADILGQMLRLTKSMASFLRDAEEDP